jgi:hypothetical protein
MPTLKPTALQVLRKSNGAFLHLAVLVREANEDLFLLLHCRFRITGNCAYKYVHLHSSSQASVIIGWATMDGAKA